MKKRHVALLLVLAIAGTSAVWRWRETTARHARDLLAVRNDIDIYVTCLKSVRSANALDPKPLREATAYLEQQLAAGTTTLFYLLPSATRAEKVEAQRTIGSLRGYKFATTNTVTAAAMELLRRSSESAAK
jgi:hypothetical protein